MTDRELFEHIDVEEMLQELGLRNVRNTYSGEIAYSCPFPGHSHLDKNPSASMTTEERESYDNRVLPKTWFYCFTCGAKGSAIDMVAQVEGVSPIVAKRFLKERFAPNFVSSLPEGSDLEGAIRSILEDQRTSPPPKKSITIHSEKTLERFYIDWASVYAEWEATKDEDWGLAYFLNRGFEPETLMDFDVGYDEISGRLTIPIRNDEGFIVGFKGRAWWPDATPKYKAIGGEEYGFTTYEMGRYLFALNIAKKECVQRKNLIVREGELNAMMLHQQGWKNAVGVSGKRITEIQQQLIRKYTDRVSFWFDELEDSLEAASHFITTMPASVITSEKDPAENSYEENLDAIVGARSAVDLHIVR